jgi:L-ascorbate metabolism protein UlaG (beta-lactamase superfamily)
MPNVPLTWLGHSSFRFDTPGGKRVYVDPWLDNPKCPDAEKEPERIDLIAITHGHGDHVGNAVDLAKKHECDVVAMTELRDWLTMEHDLPERNEHSPNTGGTVDVDGIKISVTDARHSSSYNDLTYTGVAAGLVIEVENGTKLYFAGDTSVFGDMQLIRRLYEPDVAILPIGGHFTMDPRQAAIALEFLGVKRCVPCHYGTFPLLAGTPDELRQLAPDVEVLAPEPGETVEL